MYLVELYEQHGWDPGEWHERWKQWREWDRQHRQHKRYEAFFSNGIAFTVCQFGRPRVCVGFHGRFGSYGILLPLAVRPTALEALRKAVNAECGMRNALGNRS